MTTYTPEQLTEILRLHAMWCRGEQGGARANLAGANLGDAYLAGANLGGANLADANLAGAYLAYAYLADARNFAAGTQATSTAEPYRRQPSADTYAELAREVYESSGIPLWAWAGSGDGYGYGYGYGYGMRPKRPEKKEETA